MGVSGAVAATVGLMRPLGIRGGLAGLFAGKLAPTGCVLASGTPNSRCNKARTGRASLASIGPGAFELKS